MLTKICATLLITSALCSAGCFGLSFGGAPKEVHHSHNYNYAPPTLAEELIGLKKAKNEGVLTDNEYLLAKSKVIDEYKPTAPSVEMTTAYAPQHRPHTAGQSSNFSGSSSVTDSSPTATGVPINSPSPFKQKHFRQVSAEELEPMQNNQAYSQP